MKALLAIISLGAASLAVAAEPLYEFHIVGGNDVDVAILQWAFQCNHAILYDWSQTRHPRGWANPVNGRMTAAGALRRVLDGTGLYPQVYNGGIDGDEIWTIEVGMPACRPGDGVDAPLPPCYQEARL